MAIISSRSALLQALLSGDGYGLQLQKRISEATCGLVHLTPGALYPALRALVDEGSAVDGGGGFYSLTKRGRLAAEAQRDALRGLLK